MDDCIFCKFVSGQIPVKRIYEDEWVIAFRDISPQAPSHVLVVPRVHVADVVDAASQPGLMEHLFEAVRAVAAAEPTTAGGFRVIINTGADGGQSVPHLHVHVLSGRVMGWPPG